ncbi:MAG: 6-phosphogluconolactonase [Xanthomonadales bacterium]|nr:6-phosphogluconolactonase [Xanthomonadales bacterium]
MSRHDRCPALSGFRWLAHASLGEAQSALALDLGVCIDAALADRGRAVLALAGGRTPLALYRALALQSRDWTRVHVVPTDERWVGRGHPARNEDELVAAFAAADGIRVHGLLGREAAPAPSAQTACEVLQEFEGPFDAVLLGMGQDAHTASLFPHALGLDAAWRSDADAACVVVPDPLPPEAPFARISLSRPRLLQTCTLGLLISGAPKRAVFEDAVGQAASRERPISAFLTGTPVCDVHWSP